MLERRLGSISEHEKSRYDNSKLAQGTIESLRLENQQLSDQVRQLRQQEQELLEQMAGLTQSIEYLQKENGSQLRQLETFQDQPVETSESGAFWIRQKELKLRQLEEDKKKQQQLLMRAHALITCEESQHLFQEMVRLAEEISNKEDERCRCEFDLDDLERELQQLISDPTKSRNPAMPPSEASMHKAQEMRRDINHLGSKI